MAERDDPEFCPDRSDGLHCDHWYDGEDCCGCGDAAVPLAEDGSADGPGGYMEVTDVDT